MLSSTCTNQKRQIGQAEVQLHSFLNLLIDKGKLSVLHPGSSH
jgi:hypothetical protein